MLRFVRAPREPPAGMIAFPAAKFRMGAAGPDATQREGPVHDVSLSAFAIDKTEVTVEAYEACALAGACTPSDTPNDLHGPHDESSLVWLRACNSGKPDRRNHPMNCIDWAGARSYCEFAGKRLPTEAEWEYAARSGGKVRTFPWGEQPAACDRAVMVDPATRAVGCGAVGTLPVCSRPKGNTLQGACDMAGNVAEWVADWYGRYTLETVDPKGPEVPESRVIRGGAFVYDPDLRTTRRGATKPSVRSSAVGFRCAKSIW